MPASRHTKFGFAEAEKRIAQALRKNHSGLDLRELGLTDVPDAICELTQLRRLHLNGNHLTTFPECLFSLTQLQILYLYENQLTSLPDSIGNLAQLQQLDLHRNHLTALPKSIGNLAQLQQLDLHRNQLTALPESIANLAQLQEFSLHGNSLTLLPETFGNLAQLSKLNLGNNKLTSLPESFGRLVQLETVYLDVNLLFDLPESFGNLVRLTRLHLEENQLISLPESFGNLVCLEQLALGHNQLHSLPDTFGELTQLVLLSLNGNRLSALPASFRELIRLKELYLGNNNLTSLPEWIGDITQLYKFSLHENRLSSLPDAIGNLDQLRYLYLDNNQLSSLPNAFGNLVQLKEVDLDSNNLTALPDIVGKLDQLRSLNLAGNQLTALPESLIRLPYLKQLSLHGNQGLNLPSEILGPDPISVSVGESPANPRDILVYYFAALRGQPLNEVKLLIVGRGGAGKTSLLRRLRENNFNPKQRETPGIDIRPWKVVAARSSITVHAWDFAGQVITHATHQFFLTSRSLYVLVLTGRENSEKGDADYWLRLIRAFATDPEGATAPVVIALNKCKSAPCQLDQNALQEKYPFIAGFIETDAKSNVGIAKLRVAIAKTIAGMDSVRRSFPKAWLGIKKALSNPKSDYISYGDFRDLCAKHGEPNSERQDSLSRILHELGVALNYADDTRLREHTVLNPHWVTNGIYTLLRKAMHASKPEEMTETDAERVLPTESHEMRCYLIQLMRRFELAFPMNDRGDRWLVPQRLPAGQPKLDPEWQSVDVTRIRYQYAALPEGLVPRFITRTYPLSDGQSRWVSGVILEDQDAKALVKADYEERQVTVSVIGNAHSRPVLASLVCQELQRIHDDIRGLGEQQYMELADKRGTWVLVNSLRADEKAHKSSATDSQQGSIAVDNTEELNRISRERARAEDKKNQRLKVFISYSKHDHKQKDALLIRLKFLRDEGLIEHWHDRDIRPGDEWDEEIQKQLAAADIVLCLVSNHFLTTDYIMKHEVPVMIDNPYSKKPCRIVPIILEKCLWTKSGLGKFNALPSKGSPLRNASPQRDAWHEVQVQLMTMCEEDIERNRQHNQIVGELF